MLDRTFSFLELFRFSPYDTSTEEGRSKERYRLIRLAGGSSIFAGIMTSLLSLISVPLSVGYLGKEQFGLWMVLNSLVVWIQLSDCGMSDGLVNALAEANGKKDRRAACAYVTTSLVVLSLISFILLGCLFLSYRYLPWQRILNLSSFENTLIAERCFVTLGFLFILNIPLSIVTKIFSAFQLSYITNAVQVLSSALSLIGLVAAIHFELDLPALVLIVAACPLLGNLSLWLLLRRYLPWMRITSELLSRMALSRIAKSSIPLSFYQIGVLLVNHAVNIVLAQAVGLSIVADYQILLRLYLLVFSVGTVVARPFYPALREAFEGEDHSWVSASIRRVLILRIGFSTLLSLPLLFSGDWLVKAWIGQTLSARFGFLGWLSLVTLVIFSSVSSTLSEVLLILDEIGSQIKIIMFSAVITLGGVFFFAPTSGLMAVYLAMTVSTIYPMVWCYQRLDRKLCAMR
jgi:O-antigen/teichoic acid export membrane protein